MIIKHLNLNVYPTWLIRLDISPSHYLGGKKEMDSLYKIQGKTKKQVRYDHRTNHLLVFGGWGRAR